MRPVFLFAGQMEVESGKGNGVTNPNIQRGPYGVRDGHRHPAKAVERQSQCVPGAGGTGLMVWYQQHKWSDEAENMQGRNEGKNTDGKMRANFQKHRGRKSECYSSVRLRLSAFSPRHGLSAHASRTKLKTRRECPICACMRERRRENKGDSPWS